MGDRFIRAHPDHFRPNFYDAGGIAQHVNPVGAPIAANAEPLILEQDNKPLKNPIYAALESGDIAKIQTLLTEVSDTANLCEFTQAILLTSPSIAHMQVYLAAIQALDNGIRLRELSKAMMLRSNPLPGDAYAATPFLENELDDAYNGFLSLDGRGMEWLQSCAGNGNLSGVVFGLSLIDRLYESKSVAVSEVPAMQDYLYRVMKTAVDVHQIDVAKGILQFAKHLGDETFDALLIRSVQNFPNIVTRKEAETAQFLLEAHGARLYISEKALLTRKEKLVAAFFSSASRLANLVQFNHDTLISFASYLAPVERERQLTTTDFVRCAEVNLSEDKNWANKTPLIKLSDL